MQNGGKNRNTENSDMPCMYNCWNLLVNKISCCYKKAFLWKHRNAFHASVLVHIKAANSCLKQI